MSFDEKKLRDAIKKANKIKEEHDLMRKEMENVMKLRTKIMKDWRELLPNRPRLGMELYVREEMLLKEVPILSIKETVLEKDRVKIEKILKMFQELPKKDQKEVFEQQKIIHEAWLRKQKSENRPGALLFENNKLKSQRQLIQEALQVAGLEPVKKKEKGPRPGRSH